MDIFRKNKRQFGIRSHRRVFVAIFLCLVFGVSGAFSFILNTSAAEVPVPSVEIFSEHSSFENGEPGSWKITKSAQWTDSNKARITFEVESIAKYDGAKNLDIIMVIDDSGSMTGQKMNQVKADATELVNTLLTNPENRVALITFDSTASIMSNLTNDKIVITSLISSIPTYGSTNYNQGLLKALEVLDGYEKLPNRNLVLLFLTDGFPNMETPNEIAQYKALKTNYPYIVVNGIQYEMDDTILQPIIDISDNQYIANMDSLNNVLFEAATVPYTYDNFMITDYINDDLWTIAGLDSIMASFGTVELADDGQSAQKIVWDMSGFFRAGGTAKMTIDINLKKELYNQNLLLPTNKHEEIRTTLAESSGENIDSTLTPILKSNYYVFYDPNLPSDCEYAGAAVPETTIHTIFTPVEISDVALSCSGYEFNGWKISTDGVNMINENYFRMPEKDVVLKAIWVRPSISKSMDGTTHHRAVATFDIGRNVNTKIKNLSGQANASYGTANNLITGFQKADSLSTSISLNDSNHILSATTSDIPIYGWFEGGIIYYYTDAEDIYLNPNSSYMLYSLTQLNNIDGLAEINTSKVVNLSYLLRNTHIQNVNALSDWDVSKVTNMSYMLSDNTNITNIRGLEEWDTSSLENMSGLLYHADNLNNIESVGRWNVGNVKNMSDIFAFTKITDIDALSEWNTSNVTDMSRLFYYTKQLTNVNGASEWDTSEVKNMHDLFYYNNNLVDISGMTDWNTSSLTDMSGMFWSTDITDIDALSEWDVSKVTTMQGMFAYADQLANLNGSSNWNTSSLSNVGQMLSGTHKLKNIDALANWNTSSLKHIGSLFYYTSGPTDLTAISGWDVSGVTNMAGAFHLMSSITNVDPIANWDVSNVTDMSGMFNDTRSLTNIEGISGWNVSKVKNMSEMFKSSIISDVDALSEWNTSSVTNMSQMFYNAKNLADISGLSGWNTSKVTTVEKIFYNDTLLTDLSPLNNWDTTSLTNTIDAFYNIPTEIIRPTWYIEQ